jgi:hypothetical protein
MFAYMCYFDGALAGRALGRTLSNEAACKDRKGAVVQVAAAETQYLCTASAPAKADAGDHTIAVEFGIVPTWPHVQAASCDFNFSIGALDEVQVEPGVIRHRYPSYLLANIPKANAEGASGQLGTL